MNTKSTKPSSTTEATAIKPTATVVTPGPGALSDGELDQVSAGLSLMDGGRVLPLAPGDELLNLGKLVGGKDLLAQIRPGGRGVNPIDHQSRDMD